MCSRSRLRKEHLPQSWVIVPPMVATAVQYRISCETCSRSKLLEKHLLQSCVMDLWSPGAVPSVVATAVRYRIGCEMWQQALPSK